MRSAAALTCVLLAAGSAHAQPKDPYAPQPYGPQPPPQPAKPQPLPPVTPAPPPGPPGLTTPGEPAPPDDPVLAEQVAQSIVHRAQELYDAKVFNDAKQLAVEALVKSPKGAAAEHAKYLIKKINEQLGISDEPAPEPVDLTPIEDPTKARPQPVPAAPELPRAHRLTSMVHGGLYFGLLGTTTGAFFSKDHPASGAIPLGLATAGLGSLGSSYLVDRYKWNEGQIRTVGSGTVWGGVVGGLFGDIGKKQNTTSRQVLVAASVGATAGGLGGVLLARDNQYTPGDIALVDTLAGIGAVGGLTLGMLMQPVETEAYSLNSVFGVAGGVAIGLVAAPQTNTTPRRMARVAGLSAAGGALPFLLYAGIRDNNKTSDERLTGALSSIGLLAGAYLGFKLTEGMDAGLDVSPKHRADDDGPASLMSRSSSGRWSVGTPMIQPLSAKLATQQRGAAISILGATF